MVDSWLTGEKIILGFFAWAYYFPLISISNNIYNFIVSFKFSNNTWDK